MRSIRSKILMSILLITLLISVAITSIFYGKSAEMVEENYIRILQQRDGQMIDSMDQMMQNVYQITANASCDEALKEHLTAFLSQKKEQDLEKIADILRSFYKQNAAIHSIYLLIPDELTLVTSEDYPVYRQDIRLEEMEAVMENFAVLPGSTILEDLAHDGTHLFSFAEQVADDDGVVRGYVISNISERYLYYNYMAVLDDGVAKEAVLLSRGGQIITSLGGERMGESYGGSKRYEKWISQGETAGMDEENIYIYSTAAFSRCGLFVVTKRSAVLNDLLEIRNYFFEILVLFMLIALVLAWYLTRLMYRPLKELTATIEQIADGDLDARAKIISQDEIGILAEDFNTMIERIEELIQQLIVEENQKKDAELEALQYQITPHFMYNTLNSIKYAAFIKGEKELAGVIGDFVELLQATISKKGAFLTVAEEIHILKNYIRLQEFRYGGDLQVTYEIDSETQSCLIPRLILQPLVENALLHGIDMKEKAGMLLITTETREGVLYLKVVDNGRGMTEEQIELLLTSKAKKTRGLTSIGISNVLQRLKLYYGDGGGLTFDCKGQGTTATVYMPMIENEE